MKAIHKVRDVVGLALGSLHRHVGRSVLTALGIIFGVCSVICMLAINEGASWQSQQGFRELGTSNIIIESVRPAKQQSTASGEGRGVLHYGIKRNEVAQLSDNIPGVVRCVVVHTGPFYANYAGKNLTVNVIATEPTYGRVAKMEIVSGRFITSADYLRRRPHCVLTKALADRFFAFKDPIGRIIRLKGEPFVVVGVLARLPRALRAEGGESGNHVLVPLATRSMRFGEFNVMFQQGGGTAEKVEVSQVILQMADEQAVLKGAEIARSVLARNHEDEDYLVKVPYELLEQQQAQQAIWNFVFTAVAAVSLLVGGIGIMNIMLASVTERTREIGIRRALGAKRRDIIAQFLVESIAVTTAGGLIGIVFGLLGPWAMTEFLGFVTIITPLTLVLPLVMAVIVGLLSGLYPAFRAARLDPIEALRHE